MILIGEANRLDLPRLLVRELLFLVASHKFYELFKFYEI